MVIRHWSPFNELRRMQANMDHLWRGFAPMDTAQRAESWAIPMDVTQEGDEIVVHASVPGVNPDEINVSIENDVLTIRGESAGEMQEHKEGNYLMRERRTGSFHRSLRLPDTLDTDKAQPRYENGVLTIAFPKLEAKQAKQLKVSVVQDSAK